MWLSLADVLAVLGALAQDHGVSESGPARGDVDWSAAGKVEGRKLVEPSVGVPGPVGNWAVDDGGPEETKDERWKDTSTFESTTNDDHDRAGAEDELVETKDNLRDVCAANRRSGGDVLETKVGEITDESIAGAGKGERVTPEDPLEGCDCCDEEGLEKEGETTLSSC